MQKRLSNYIEVIPYNDGFVLFNKLNSNILFLDNEYIFITDGKVTVDCSDEDAKVLDDCGFFVEDSVVREYIRKECMHQQIMKRTSVILSVTEKCNLSCKYCYQSKWKKDDELSDNEYSSIVLEYIKEIIPKINDIEGVLNVYFIGGEPLLKSNLIISITQEVMRFIDEGSYDYLTTKFHIDTNGLLLTRDFIERFPNLCITTTLSLAEDHNNLRSESFEQLYSVLSGLTDVFDGAVYRLNIRYNTHHGNFSDLDKFLKSIDQIGIKYSLDIQNIMNTPTADFVNKLNDDDFEKVYLRQFVPCLLKHNIVPNILPITGLSRHCSCANVLSRKYYSNGQIVLCDAMPKSNRDEPLGAIPPLPEMCVRCYDFPYCGGPKPCDKSECSGIYSKKSAVRERIIAYIESESVMESD